MGAKTFFRLKKGGEDFFQANYSQNPAYVSASSLPDQFYFFLFLEVLLTVKYQIARKDKYETGDEDDDRIGGPKVAKNLQFEARQLLAKLLRFSKI